MCVDHDVKLLSARDVFESVMGKLTILHGVEAIDISGLESPLPLHGLHHFTITYTDIYTVAIGAQKYLVALGVTSLEPLSHVDCAMIFLPVKLPSRSSVASFLDGEERNPAPRANQPSTFTARRESGALWCGLDSTHHTDAKECAKIMLTSIDFIQDSCLRTTPDGYIVIPLNSVIRSLGNARKTELENSIDQCTQPTNNNDPTRQLMGSENVVHAYIYDLVDQIYNALIEVAKKYRQ